MTLFLGLSEFLDLVLTRMEEGCEEVEVASPLDVEDPDSRFPSSIIGVLNVYTICFFANFSR